MRSSMFGIGLVIVGFAVALQAVPASAAIDKCEKSVVKNGAKALKLFQKPLGKCVDAYHKAVVKGEDLSLKTAFVCNTQLLKATDLSNPAGGVAKTLAGFAKLTDPAKPTCTDAELLELGHLPFGTFGDKWARIVVLSALQDAWQGLNIQDGQLSQIMQELADAGCPLCADLVRAPCHTVTCSLGAASHTDTVVAGADTSSPITGNLILGVCEFNGGGVDLIPGHLATIAGSSLGIRPTVLGAVSVCSRAVRSTGLINCTGGAGTLGTVGTTTCQDSDLSDNGGADDCQTLLPGATCTDGPDASTGGVCSEFAQGAPTVGASISVTSSQLTVVLPGQEGTDMVACTPDDTAALTPVAQLLLTTGTATTHVLDYADTPGDDRTKTASGTPGGSCALARSGDVSASSVAGAFPAALPGAVLGDTASAVTLSCN